MSYTMAGPSSNARKRVASEDIYDAERFRDPSFRDESPEWVKSEEEPVNISLVPEDG
jgi:hypothetical protein